MAAARRLHRQPRSGLARHRLQPRLAPQRTREPSKARPLDGRRSGLLNFAQLRITLTGPVLPIGGVKEKVLAAHRAGIGTVILPKLNGDGLAELPDELRDEMPLKLADRIEQVLDVALEPVAQPV